MLDKLKNLCCLAKELIYVDFSACQQVLSMAEEWEDRLSVCVFTSLTSFLAAFLLSAKRILQWSASLGERSLSAISDLRQLPCNDSFARSRRLEVHCPGQNSWPGSQIHDLCRSCFFPAERQHVARPTGSRRYEREARKRVTQSE